MIDLYHWAETKKWLIIMSQLCGYSVKKKWKQREEENETIKVMISIEFLLPYNLTLILY